MLLYKRIRFAERLAPVLLAAQHLDIIDGAFDIVDAHLPENLLAGHQGRQLILPAPAFDLSLMQLPHESLRFLIGELKNLSLVEAVGDQQVDLPDFIGEPLLMAVQLRHEISQPAKGLMNLLDEWRVGR